MSTTAPEKPVAPAAASPAPIAPTAAPAPTPPADTKEMASKLFKLLVDTKDAPAAEPKPVVTEKKPEPAAAAPAAPAEKPIKVREKKKPAPEAPPPIPTREASEHEKQRAFVDAAIKSAKAPEISDEEFEKDLVEEEREQLETARRAEKLFGDKHKGLADKTKKFLKEHAEKVSAPDFDEEDPDYQKWVKANVPKLTPMEVRKIDEARITERVSRDSRAENEKLRHEMYARDVEPKIKQEGSKIYNRLASSALPDEVKQAFEAKTKELGDAKKAVEVVQAEYKLEFEVAEEIIGAATADIEEFKRLTTENPQTKRNLRELENNNPQHDRILKMVSEVCADFKREGGEALKKDGRWFATREEWVRIPDDQKRNWWTFNNEEIIERALSHVPLAINYTVKQRREEFEKRGFTRQRAAAPAAPSAPIPPGSSAPAAPRPAPVPGANGGQALTPGEILAARLNQKSA